VAVRLGLPIRVPGALALFTWRLFQRQRPHSRPGPAHRRYWKRGPRGPSGPRVWEESPGRIRRL